jgi:hypothetical protein
MSLLRSSSSLLSRAALASRPMASTSSLRHFSRSAAVYESGSSSTSLKTEAGVTPGGQRDLPAEQKSRQELATEASIVSDAPSR